MDKQKKQEAIASHFRAIFEILGEKTETLKDTPQRLAKFYREQVFSFLEGEDKLTLSPLLEGETATLITAKVPFISYCEHHLLPIDGIAYLSYQPRGKIAKLAHFNEIVRHFAKRPQLQERLCTQIADTLANITGSKDVAVIIKAKHYCTLATDKEGRPTTLVTSDIRGKLKTHKLSGPL